MNDNNIPLPWQERRENKEKNVSNCDVALSREVCMAGVMEFDRVWRCFVCGEWRCEMR
jgi:hypothetical protein